MQSDRVQLENIASVMSYIDDLTVELFGNDVMRRHTWSPWCLSGVSVVLCQVAGRVSVLMAHVEQRPQQISLRELRRTICCMH